jgi:hypothetical protein
LQLTIAEAHIAAVTVNRFARELAEQGKGETILAGTLRRIGEQVERQASAGVMALDEAERAAALEEVLTLADALGLPDA